MNTIEKINRDWDFVIGIEVQVQLETKSKMFSTCEYTFDQSPNTLTCPTSIGLPGALPSINEKAIDFAIQFGGAVNATVHPSFSFARKHYFYPDLPKGYQISQFDKPIVTAITEAPTFYIAEEYHQDFYKKQSARYQIYAEASGRKGFLEETWGDE